MQSVDTAIATPACTGSITGTPRRSSSGARWRAMPAHPEQHVGSIDVAQCLPDLGQTVQRMCASGAFGDRQVERLLAGQPFYQAELAQVAQVAPDRRALERQHAGTARPC